MVVLFSATFDSAVCIICSDLLSSDDVASSNTRIFGCFKIARAIAMRCFSPPESFKPRSPTMV
jgi:hypothetical protein